MSSPAPSAKRKVSPTQAKSPVLKRSHGKPTSSTTTSGGSEEIISRDPKATVEAARKEAVAYSTNQGEMEDLKKRLFTGDLAGDGVVAEGSEQGLGERATAHVRELEEREAGRGRLKGPAPSFIAPAGGISDRSKHLIEKHQKRADECFEHLRDELTFLQKHDQSGVIPELQGVSLAAFLQGARSRAAIGNRSHFKSAMNNYERMNLFESEVEALEVEELLQPDIREEEELREIGLKLGILTEDGKWKPKCDCESKFIKMKGKAREDALRITKAKFNTAFVREIDRMVNFIDEFMAETRASEEQRRIEVDDLRDKQFQLINRLQAQQKLIDRLRKKGSGTNNKLEEEHSEATQELSNMKAYVELLESGKAKGKVGAGKDLKEVKRRHAREMKRVHHSSAVLERTIMARHDVDGFVDPAIHQFEQMRNKFRKPNHMACQTLSEEELLVEHGVMPAHMKLSGGNSTLKSNIAKVSLPTVRTEASSFPEEIPDMEESCKQLLSYVSTAIGAMDEGRVRVMNSVASLCPSGSDLETELAPLFSHTNNVALDTCNRLATDLKVSLRKLGHSGSSAVKKATEMGSRNGWAEANATFIDERQALEAKIVNAEGKAAQLVLKNQVQPGVTFVAEEASSNEPQRLEPKKSSKKITPAPKKAPSTTKSSGSLKKGASSKIRKGEVLSTPANFDDIPQEKSMSFFSAPPEDMVEQKLFDEAQDEIKALKTDKAILETQFRGFRDAVASTAQCLLQNDIIGIRPDMIEGLEQAQAADTINGRAQQVLGTIKEIAEGPSPSAPHILIETVRSMRKALEGVCRTAIEEKFTFPSFILPEINTEFAFSDHMSCNELSTVLVRSEQHIGYLNGILTKQHKKKMTDLLTPLKEGIIKCTSQVKQLASNIQEILPDFYVDEPVQAILGIPIQQTVEEAESSDDANEDPIGFWSGRLASYLSKSTDAIDNMEYFLQEHQKHQQQNAEEEAKARAEEMASELYTKMVADGDKAVLRENNRAAKIKKEVDERIREESERFKQFAEEENERLRKVQENNKRRVEENEKHTAEILALKEEYIKNQERRAEKAKQDADETVELEAARIIEAQRVLFENMMKQMEQNQEDEHKELSAIEDHAFRSVLDLFQQIQSTIQEAEALMALESTEDVEVFEEEGEDWVNPVLNAETPDRGVTPAPEDTTNALTNDYIHSSSIISNPLGDGDGIVKPPTPLLNSVQSTSILSLKSEASTLVGRDEDDTRTRDSGGEEASTLAGSSSLLLAPKGENWNEIQTQTDPVVITLPVKKKSVGVTVRLGLGTHSSIMMRQSSVSQPSLEVQQATAKSEGEEEGVRRLSTFGAIPHSRSEVFDSRRESIVADQQPSLISPKSRTSILTLEGAGAPTMGGSTRSSSSGVLPPAKDFRELAVQTISFDDPNRQLSEEEIRAAPAKPMLVDCCSGPLQPIPTFEDASQDTPERGVLTQIKEAFAQIAPSFSVKDCQTPDSLLKNFRGGGAGLSLSQAEESDDTSSRGGRGDDHLLVGGDDTPGAVSLDCTHANLELPTTDTSTPPTPLPPPTIEVVTAPAADSSTLTSDQQPEVKITSPPLPKGQTKNSRAQTVITTGAIDELLQRPAVPASELMSLGHTLADLNEAFLKVVPSATDLQHDIKRKPGSAMLTAWDQFFNELTFYLRDLMSMTANRKNRATDLLGTKRRNTHVQATVAVKVTGTCTGEDVENDYTVPRTPPDPNNQHSMDEESRDRTPPNHHSAKSLSSPTRGGVNLNAAPTVDEAVKKLILLENDQSLVQESAQSLHEHLYELLPHLSKRLKLNGTSRTNPRAVDNGSGAFQDPFPVVFGEVTKNHPLVLLRHDDEILHNLLALLKRDSLSSKRRTSATMEHAVVSRKLNRFLEHRKAGAFPEEVPQVAAFLERQEKKLRASLDQFSRLKKEMAEEKERALRDFFLPSCDAEAISYMSPVMQRRKVFTGIPRISTPLDQHELTPGGRTSLHKLQAMEETMNHPASNFPLKRSAFLHRPAMLAPVARSDANVAEAVSPSASTPPPEVSSELHEGEGKKRGEESLSRKERAKSLPALVHLQEGDPNKDPSFLDIVARGKKRVQKAEFRKKCAGPSGTIDQASTVDQAQPVGHHSHPSVRHLVVPKRTTQLHPARDFFLQPLTGHSSALQQLPSKDVVLKKRGQP